MLVDIVRHQPFMFPGCLSTALKSIFLGVCSFLCTLSFGSKIKDFALDFRFLNYLWLLRKEEEEEEAGCPAVEFEFSNIDASLANSSAGKDSKKILVHCKSSDRVPEWRGVKKTGTQFVCSFWRHGTRYSHSHTRLGSIPSLSTMLWHSIMQPSS